MVPVAPLYIRAARPAVTEITGAPQGHALDVGFLIPPRRLPLPQLLQAHQSRGQYVDRLLNIDDVLNHTFSLSALLASRDCLGPTLAHLDENLARVRQVFVIVTGHGVPPRFQKMVTNGTCRMCVAGSRWRAFRHSSLSIAGWLRFFGTVGLPLCPNLNPPVSQFDL